MPVLFDHVAGYCCDRGGCVNSAQNTAPSTPVPAVW
jgi:hypothetical protein